MTTATRSYLRGFTEMLWEIHTGYPDDTAALRTLADGAPEPSTAEQEDTQRVRLAMLAAKVWAPAALNAAGFEAFAEALENAADVDEAVEVMGEHYATLPARRYKGPYSIDDRAEQAADGALCACHDGSRTSGAAARALKAAFEAVRIARQTNPNIPSMNVAEEAAKVLAETTPAA